MTSLAELVLTPPVGGTGAQISHTAKHWDIDFVWDVSNWDGDLWIAVEMAVPTASATSLWDVAVWDVDVWSEPQWLDLTCYVQGVQWRRGGSPGEQPDPGELTMWLDNTSGMFVPWSPTPFTSPAYMGAGTLIRVSVHDSAGWWQPQIVAVSTGWNRRRESQGQVHWVEIGAVDASSSLEGVKQWPVPAEGVGDSVSERFARLLDAAGWAYGYDAGTVDEQTPITLQATTMEGSRLEELRTLADAFDGRFSVARDGRAVIGRTPGRWLADGVFSAVLSTHSARYSSEVPGEPEGIGVWDESVWDGALWAGDPWVGTVTGTVHLPYEADSMEEANDDEALVTVVNVSADGGEEYEYFEPTAVARYGRGFTVERTDLPYEVSGELAWGGDLATRILSRGLHKIRPLACTIDAGWSFAQLVAIATLDHDLLVNVLSPDVAFTDARICEVEHRLILANGSFTWMADISLDVSDTYSWRAAP